jgi:hypothetical protein
VLLLHPIDHPRHFIQFFGTDIRTVREAEVNQAVFPLQTLLGEFFPVVVHEMEGSADERFADAFVRFGDAGARHARFFVAEVEGQPDAGEEEEDAGLPAEGLLTEKEVSGGGVEGWGQGGGTYAEFVAGFGFLDGFVCPLGAGGEGAGILGGWSCRGL